MEDKENKSTNIGIIGYAGSGKTTLTSAIASVMTNRGYTEAFNHTEEEAIQISSIDYGKANEDKTVNTIQTKDGEILAIVHEYYDTNKDKFSDKKYLVPGMHVRSTHGDYGIITFVNETLDTATVCTKIDKFSGSSFTTYDNASKVLSYDEDEYTIGIVGYNEDSLVDGDYVRTVVYIGGCTHLCPECHNREYWDKVGTLHNIDKFYDEYLKENKYITISGGDGLTIQYTQTLNLLKLLKHKGHNVWLYTGYTFEELINSDKKECLNYIDVLVDGKYEKDKRDITLFFRGSSNQRIIDVQQSLNKGEVIIHELEGL